MSSPFVRDADASRPRSGILTPSSDGSLNRHDACLPPDGRKRKRDDAVAMEHLLKPSIAVKPHPPNLHVQPRVLLPLMLLRREHLPLACIDFNAAHTDASPNRFFESHIKILDLESRLGAAPSVLIARNESRNTVHALERQDNGLYVMCQLGSWVELESLAARATAISKERLRPARPERHEPATSAALTTPHMHKEAKIKRAAIEAIQSLMRKRARSQSVSTFEDATKREATMEPEALQSQLPSPAVKPEDQLEPSAVVETVPEAPMTVGQTQPEELAPQNTAEDMFDNIRNHYFDALYKSMGSLAYFAKGPLSRVRSAFHLDLEANLDMADLIDFLKGLVLSTIQVDKKYRETIPDVIATMKASFESSDEGHKKKRKARKMKLGKDGLYPMEDEKIRKWWETNKPELKDDNTNITTAQIKSHVSLLRTRETQLQMILIMEILALEPLKAPEEATDSGLPTLPGVADSQLQSMDPPPAPLKKRNKHNLPVLMDVHADRLTIWQSTASDEQLLLEDSQINRLPNDGQLQKSSSEPLKDFCVDVIVPFFSARLPQLCDSINRKLGGPVIVSPPKSKGLKRSSSMRELKPGAATKRPSQPNTQRTLQRALSTDQHHRRSVSRGPGNAIALMRSATSTSLSGVKREGSEPLGSKMGMKNAADQPRQRPTLLSRSNSMANIDDARASKKAQVEAELKDAISALRKPNREIVSKAVADAAQHRSSTGLSAKKIKKPARSSLGAHVQVKATPANHRFKNVFGVKSEDASNSPQETFDDFIPPSSIGPFVPSTVSRRGHRDAMTGSASPAQDLVGSTPIRPSMKSTFIRRPVNEEPAIPPSSPLMRRTTSGQDNDLVLGSVEKPWRMESFHHDDGVVETPIKKTMPRPTSDDVFGSTSRAEEPKLSIYQQLGWDDDLDDF